jgi:hypothetical protein
MDISQAVLMRHGRDESSMYRGQAAWSGSNAGYDTAEKTADAPET